MWWFLVIALNVLFLSFGSPNTISQNIVELCDENGNFLSNGLIVSENSLIIPKSAFNKSNEMKHFKYFEELGSFGYFNVLPVGSFTKIGNAAYIFTSKTKTFSANRVIRVSRYPLYGNAKYYAPDTSADTTWSSSGTRTTLIDVQLLSDEKCKKMFSTFNPKNQVCVENENVQPNSPLIALTENTNFLIGFTDKESNLNATIFNLINEKSYNFPNYRRCENEKDYSSLFSFCNSIEICENLKESDHPEIIVVGNVEAGNNASFIPIEFGTVVSDDQILVTSKVMDSLKDYEIYGNGKKLKVALMLNDIVIQEDCFQLESNVSYKNAKTFQLLKYNHPIFKNVSKANFIFDESFKNVNGKLNIENVKTFKFFDQKLIVQAENVKDTVKGKEISALTPLFSNDQIIGFKEDDFYFSAFGLGEFLKSHITHLQQETILSTPKADTTVVTTPAGTTFGIPTITESHYATHSNDTVTTFEPDYSGSNKLTLALWPLILVLVYFF